jgi:hypothetical protein
MTSWEEQERKAKAEWEKLNKQDADAKAKGTILGRYFSESVADGMAVYIIVKINKNTVRIKHFPHTPDCYKVSYWGDEATIDKTYAEKAVGFRDFWNNLPKRGK